MRTRCEFDPGRPRLRRLGVGYRHRDGL